jgi:hypothetical protein
MKKTAIVFIMLLLGNTGAFTQPDSITVGKVRTADGRGRVYVPVYFTHSAGYCSSQIHLTWKPAGERIKALGIAPGDVGVWQFTVESLDQKNGVISVVGENPDTALTGKFVAFYLAFSLEDPDYQTIGIGSDGTARFGSCDGIDGIEPAFAAGELSYVEYLPGDANGSAAVNGLDVTYMIGYLRGRSISMDGNRAADTNGDCRFNILDVTFLVNYLENRGPEPILEGCR